MHNHRIDIDLPSALRALADEPHLALIDSCGHGGTILTWGTAPQRLRQLSDIRVSRGHCQPAATAAWPCGIHGGALIQLDYEFPVGSWAAPTKNTGQGQLWPLQSWASFDNDDGSCTLWAENEQQTGAMTQRLQDVKNRTQTSTARTLHCPWDYEQYSEHITGIQNYIRDGDVYQVNLTMPFTCTLAHGHDTELFLQLRQRSPAPYAAFFRNGAQTIISHSPERFISVHQNQCSSHPIKGTCKRIHGQEDKQRAALLTSDKDQAELAMIVDLVRNDMGRISLPGSVHVAGATQIMDLPYVHHALTHIQSTLRADISHQDILAACFPPGSITGAPKIRAMEIIQELENQHRGAYCGSFGWLGAGNSCELAVAIRCMQTDGEHLRFDAGGGIVIDSQAHSEWQELHDKASAMSASLTAL